MDNKLHLGYDTYTPLLFGSYPAYGVNNGRWSIEYWDAAGGLNFWMPWPTPNSQNNVLFLRDDGFVGIGTSSPSQTLDVMGDIGCNNIHISSDVRLKSNIQLINSVQVNKLYQLQGKTYNKKLDLQLIPLNGVIDTLKRKTIQGQNTRMQSNANVSRPEFGYIAQDIQQLFPELVSGDTSSHLSVNYIGLIPVIIEALKQQKQTITALTQQLSQCCVSNNSHQNQSNGSQYGKKSADLEASSRFTAFLLQNSPNPFTENTNIFYSIPESSGKAMLYIYDMQGSEILSYEIKHRGEGKTIINGNELKAGMYLYALIIDGNEIDTKRMILTK
jgi:hypothetical protein